MSSGNGGTFAIAGGIVIDAVFIAILWYFYNAIPDLTSKTIILSGMAVLGFIGAMGLFLILLSIFK